MKLRAEPESTNHNLEQQSGLKTGWIGPHHAFTSKEGKMHVRPGFEWTKADAYLFDVDGTLLNSRDAVHYHAFHHAVAEVFGLDLRLDGIPIHGNTDIGILRAYLESAAVPENLWRTRMPQVVEVMGNEVERHASELRPEVCPGVPVLIEQLTSRGKLLGVASGNVEQVAWAKLRACGLSDYFRFGAFSGILEKREEIIAHGVQRVREIRGQHASACVIGDTPADVRAAQANGIGVIAVATGIYSTDELLAHQPDMCISCCGDLVEN